MNSNMTDPKLILRVATLEDIESLSRLYCEFHNFHAKSVPDRLLGISEQPDIHEGTSLYHSLKKIIQSMDSEIFIAEADHQAIGFAEIYIRQDEANPLTVPYGYGYLQTLIITKRYRLQGMGAQLMRAVEGWAKEKGASEIRLDIWEFNEGPLAFYERMGYRTMKRTMVYRISMENESNG